MDKEDALVTFEDHIRELRFGIHKRKRCSFGRIFVKLMELREFRLGFLSKEQCHGHNENLLMEW